MSICIERLDYTSVDRGILRRRAGLAAGGRARCLECAEPTFRHWMMNEWLAYQQLRTELSSDPGSLSKRLSSFQPIRG